MSFLLHELQVWSEGVFPDDDESQQKAVAAAKTLLEELEDGMRQQTTGHFHVKVTRQQGRPTAVFMAPDSRVA